MNPGLAQRRRGGKTGACLIKTLYVPGRLTLHDLRLNEERNRFERSRRPESLFPPDRLFHLEATPAVNDTRSEVEGPWFNRVLVPNTPPGHHAGDIVRPSNPALPIPDSDEEYNFGSPRPRRSSPEIVPHPTSPIRTFGQQTATTDSNRNAVQPTRWEG